MYLALLALLLRVFLLPRRLQRLGAHRRYNIASHSVYQLASVIARWRLPCKPIERAMAPTLVPAAPRRLLRALTRAPRLPSQPGAGPDSPASASASASSPEIELDLLGPQRGDGPAPADHPPADCQQISSVRRRVTQLSTTAAALESPASTPSSSPITAPTPPLAWPPTQPLAHFRRHARNGSVTSLVSDASSLSTASGAQNRRSRSQRQAEAESVWRDYWS